MILDQIEPKRYAVNLSIDMFDGEELTQAKVDTLVNLVQVHLGNKEADQVECVYFRELKPTRMVSEYENA